MSRAFRSVAALCVALCFAGCAEEAPTPPPRTHEDGAMSSVSIRLEATSTSGVRYRLRNFAVALVGPVYVEVYSEDVPSDASVMSVTLPAGSYVAHVNPSWILDRFFEDTPIPVAATIADTQVAFDVLPGQTANLSFAFRTFDDFAMPGGVDVGFTVDDSPPATWSTPPSPTVTPLAVTNDRHGNVFALVQSGGLKVISYTSWGAIRFTTPLPAEGNLPATTAYALRVLEYGRLVATWDAQRTNDSALVIAVLDAYVGTFLGRNVIPFANLGFTSTTSTPQIHAAITIGPLGRIAVASMPGPLVSGNSKLATLDQNGNVLSQASLGFRANAEWTSDIRLAVAGPEERVLIAIPLMNNGTYTLRMITPTGSLVWSNSTLHLSAVASDAAGNVFALRTNGPLIRYDAASGTALWSTPALVSPTKLSCGTTSVAVLAQTSTFSPWVIRRYSTATGSMLGTSPIPFSFIDDAFTDIAMDPTSAVALGIRRVTAGGVIGRVAP